MNPADGADDVGEDIQLKWSCQDADGDALSYDIYLDTEQASTLLARVEDDSVYDISGLLPSTVYRWKVIARDQIGSTTSSPIGSFTVGAPRIERLKEIFPLVVGNTWTYIKVTITESSPPLTRDTTYTQTTTTVTESATGMLPDPSQRAYHVIGEPLKSSWYAYSDSGVVELNNGEWVLYGPTYHFPLPSNTTISFFGDEYSSGYQKVVDASATVEVNGSIYSDCYEYAEGGSTTSPMANSSGHASTIYLAPGLGLIRQVLYVDYSTSYGYTFTVTKWDLQESSVQRPD